MKIIHFTNNTFDGGGRLTYQIHQNLIRNGIDSTLLVYQKDTDDPTVIELSDIIDSTTNLLPKIQYRFLRLKGRVLWRLALEKYKFKDLFNQNRDFILFKALMPYLQQVDIVCYSSPQYYLSSSLVRQIYNHTGAPIVWTLMDVEPFTGGCHFNNGCDLYRDSCGNCIKLGKGRNNDISFQNLQKKIKDYKGLPIHVVAGSTNLFEMVRNSKLFGQKKIVRIVAAVDENNIVPIPKGKARERLNLPAHKKIILFGCFDLNSQRKGGKYLLEAINLLQRKMNYSDQEMFDRLVLLTIGKKNGFPVENTAIHWIHLGRIKDNKVLSEIYSAVDVYACPSIDDAGPMMINEAYHCGTPVVAFNSGVGPDLLQSPEIGHVAELFDIESFSIGLEKFLFGDKISNEQQSVSRDLCKAEFQAAQYIKLFDSMTNRAVAK
jgi:glycosyltransferase involved in cell wall biosynthesis